MKLRPGWWEMSSQSDIGGVPVPKMPKLTPEQEAKLAKAGVKLPASGSDGGMAVQYCMTKEQAERSEPPRPKDSDKMKCEKPEQSRSGSTVNWKIVCTGEREMTGTGSMTISSPEAYTGTSSMTVRDPQRGSMTMNSKVQGKWLSDTCPKK
jgi:hypothetical protein